MRKGLYVIVDRKAEEILGNIIHVTRHEAPAVRSFDDAARMPQSIIGQHPEDFDLVRLGYLEEDLTLTVETETILRGSTWAAAQAPTEGQ